MKTSLCVFAALMAAALGLTQTVQAQYGPGPESPYGAYPAMPGAGMPGMGMPVGYGPEAQAPMAMAPSPQQALAGNSEPDCEPGFGCNRWFGFAEFLALRARDSEVAWAVPIDGATDADPLVRPPVQVGRVGVADLDFQPAYRVGFGRILNEASSLGFTYTEFQGNTHDALTATAPNVLRPLVTHPSTFNVASDYLDGFADYGIRFKTIDVDYHSLFAYCCDYQLGYTLGIRYGQLQQNFRADFAANGTEFVDTSVNFYGTGLKAGLDGERYSYSRNLFVYGKTFLSLLGGETKARFDQGSSFDPSIVSTTWKAGRLVTIHDLELGAGWQNDCGNVRLSIGYTYSTWYNVTRTNEWINAVQRNNFADPSDNFNAFMTFDGLVTRLEVRW
ncbi:MAG: hypothetical protein ACR2FY_14290 [Pirellulaceae bacterium]